MTHELQRIRRRNDEARMFLTDGTVFSTRGIAGMPTEDQAAILERVRTFDDFDRENDPYGEHDFGAFDYKGDRIFWKIYCYDRQMPWGSPDPTNPRVTKRIITIMLASEY